MGRSVVWTIAKILYERLDIVFEMSQEERRNAAWDKYYTSTLWEDPEMMDSNNESGYGGILNGLNHD